MRMDRYEDEVKEENFDESTKNLSRLEKNKQMYDDVYLNSSYDLLF